MTTNTDNRGDVISVVQKMIAALEGISKYLAKPRSGGERLIVNHRSGRPIQLLTHYDPESEDVFEAIDAGRELLQIVMQRQTCKRCGNVAVDPVQFGTKADNVYCMECTCRECGVELPKDSDTTCRECIEKQDKENSESP